MTIKGYRELNGKLEKMEKGTLTLELPKKEIIKEHKQLVKKLDDCVDMVSAVATELNDESEKQAGELKEYKEKSLGKPYTQQPGRQPGKGTGKITAKEEFKVGDVLDPQGKTNMAGKVKIRDITGNTIKFVDSEGTEYSGMQRSLVRELIKQGSWKKVSSESDWQYELAKRVDKVIEEWDNRDLEDVVDDCLKEISHEDTVGDDADNYKEVAEKIWQTKILPQISDGDKIDPEDAKERVYEIAKKIAKRVYFKATNRDEDPRDPDREYDERGLDDKSLGKPYTQQPGRKPGKGAGKIVVKEPGHTWTDKDIQWLMKLPMKELRQRQDIANQEAIRAYEQRDERAGREIDKKRDALYQAVYKKNFGEFPKVEEEKAIGKPYTQQKRQQGKGTGKIVQRISPNNEAINEAIQYFLSLQTSKNASPQKVQQYFKDEGYEITDKLAQHISDRACGHKDYPFYTPT